MNTPLASMFRYNKWANIALLEGCRTLTDEQLDARLAGASGSVRGLLLHVVGGQQTCALRTQGRQHEGELNRRSEWPGFAIAEALYTDSDVDLPYLGKSYRYPKSFFLLHAMEHGVEHRTEIKVTLAHLGVETPDLDGWPYSAAAGYGREV